MAEIILNPINPSASLTKWYREQMQSMMDDMRADLIKEVIKPMRSELAMDGIADWLGHVMDSLVGRWQSVLDTLAKDVAQEVVGKSKKDYEKRLMKILRKKGFTVNFNHSARVQEQSQIALGENVALIKSIGNEYLDKVNSAVWRSVKNGYDVQSLIGQLRQIDGVTDRRAKTIARDQVGKLNQAFEDARAAELGVKEAIWLHSSASKEPRIEHVRANGQRYEIDKGIQFSNGWYRPRQDFNCKCGKRLIIEIPNLSE